MAQSNKGGEVVKQTQGREWFKSRNLSVGLENPISRAARGNKKREESCNRGSTGRSLGLEGSVRVVLREC